MTVSILCDFGAGTTLATIFILFVFAAIKAAKAEDLILLIGLLMVPSVFLYLGVTGELEGRPYGEFGLSSAAACIYAAEIILAFLWFTTGRWLIRRREYRRYVKDHKRICRKIDDILSEKGIIELENRELSTGIACLPDGRIRTVNFGRAAGDWLLQEAVGTNICPSVRAEDILKSPDAVILKSGKYRSDAAKRIVRRAKKKCREIDRTLEDGTVWLKNRSIIYVTGKGKVRNAVFDLPTEELFPELARADGYSRKISEYVASEEEILSAAREKH